MIDTLMVVMPAGASSENKNIKAMIKRDHHSFLF